MSSKHRVFCLLPVLLGWLADVVLTLHSQCHAFWSSDYSQAVEGNPIARVVLLEGPSWFVAFAFLMLMIAVGFIMLGKPWLAKIVAG